MILTKDTLADIWMDIAVKYKTRTELKQKSRTMRWFGRVLATLGIMTYKRWMSYSMGYNSVIYTSFRVGSDDMSLAGQLATCAHEHVHIAQGRRIKRFLMKYTRSVWRARFEREAYAVGALVFCELSGQEPLEYLATRKLKQYELSDKHMTAAKKYFDDVFSGRKKCHIVGRQIIAMIRGRK
jgi:hypothetical protein